MAKIHAMMDIGKRSMMNSQTALQTVSHNIANKTTEGYSRQRVELQTAVPIVEGRHQLGMGSRAAAVTRTNNPFLEKQLQKETGQMGLQQGRESALTRVEQVFNEQMNKGLNQYMTDFFNSYRELSNNPESITTRTMVKEAGESVVKDFKRVDDQLLGIQKDVDERVRNETEEVNKLSREIAQLNEKIAEVEVQGIPANDQRDRRDVCLKKMNEKIDIHYAEGDQGAVTVTTAGNAILVSGFDNYELTTKENPETNRMDVYFKPNESTPPFRITDRIKGGTIGGGLNVRDQIIPDFKEKMDQLAYTFAEEINRAHVEGFDKLGRQGEFFFDMPTQVVGAARSLSVNEKIVNDVNRITAAAKPGAVGDNTVANVISQLQYKGIMDGNTTTMDDFYNSQVGRVGVLTQRAIKARESQDNVLQQLNTIRESISGVSLDEETTNMIEFQRAFDASARVIKTADEMFDTVLNLKRL
ncbi:MAG: flagellar hook-associated protein FlgK [Pseudobdellovibrionaceae bacterium]